MSFSEEELRRYHRQMMMDGWGEATQEKLKDSTVFIAGAGGLGSPVSIYLAVAGVGRMRICDFDTPDWTNLNRQILHDHTRIGVNKAVSAQITIRTLNHSVAVTSFTAKIVAENVDELVGDADIILDCMDNFPTRYLLNESRQEQLCFNALHKIYYYKGYKNNYRRVHEGMSISRYFPARGTAGFDLSFVNG